MRGGRPHTDEVGRKQKKRRRKNMKVKVNAKHNSLELDFSDGGKPSQEVRELLKAYGFWWFGKEKLWCHTLAIDGAFFERFVEERVRPLAEKAAASSAPVTSAAQVDVAAMSDEEKNALVAKLAALMGK